MRGAALGILPVRAILSAVVLVGLAMWSLGCHSIAEQRRGQTAAAQLRVWQEERLVLDLQFLAGSAPVDSGFQQLTAAYVQAQMHGLQPALSRSSVVAFHTSDTMGIKPSNVISFAAGVHPVHASELVIVAADLNVSQPDRGLAALMEIARTYGLDAERGYTPDRTIMISAFAGQAGLQAYLRHPLWPLEHTRAFVFLGPGDEDSLADAIMPYGVPVYFVRFESPALVDDAQESAREALQMVVEADALLAELSAAVSCSKHTDC